MRHTALWQIDVATAAETDQTKTLARIHFLAFMHERQDTPRHQTGDLHNYDLFAVRCLNQH